MAAHAVYRRMKTAGASALTRIAVIFACLWLLAGCVYPNPNINTYGWQPPPGPSPLARSYLGYDPNYEQSLIDQYVAANPERVQTFRRQQLGL